MYDKRAEIYVYVCCSRTYAGGTGKPGTKLFVGNLPHDCTNSELRTLFEPYGEITECEIIKDFAFVVSTKSFVPAAFEYFSAHNVWLVTLTSLLSLTWKKCVLIQI